MENDLPELMVIDDQIYYIVFSPASLPVAIISLNQNRIVETFEFSPYGNKLSQSDNKTPFSLGIAGSYLDRDLKLNYMMARYYDPKIRQFVSPDPVGVKVWGLNQYAYSHSDPVNFVDPDGHFPVLSLAFKQGLKSLKIFKSGKNFIGRRMGLARSDFRSAFSLRSSSKRHGAKKNTESVVPKNMEAPKHPGKETVTRSNKGQVDTSKNTMADVKIPVKENKASPVGNHIANPPKKK